MKTNTLLVALLQELLPSKAWVLTILDSDQQIQTLTPTKQPKPKPGTPAFDALPRDVQARYFIELNRKLASKGWSAVQREDAAFQARRRETERAAAGTSPSPRTTCPSGLSGAAPFLEKPENSKPKSNPQTQTSPTPKQMKPKAKGK